MLHDIMGLDRALPWLLTAFALGYGAGSIPFGIAISRLFGLRDPRKVGSGNIGATNVLRSGHRGAAALTLMGDALKGAVPVLVLMGWGDLSAQAAALGALIGHCFPIWLRFRGGKGVATFLGTVVALHTWTGIGAAIIWLVAARLSRISSVGALAATASAPLWLVAFSRWEAVLAVTIAVLIVWIRHAENIRRLIQDQEPRIGSGGSSVND
ncbi:MAG: glycerol-3-phosphate 1-O-acyltransferase PlsY [Pseudomonadota bacterium]